MEPGPLAKIGWVGLGGFLGANARYWLGVWLQERLGETFPWATLIVNVTGSFVLGLLLAAATERFTLPAPPVLRLAVAAGFLGAYTTFSTFEYETLALLRTGAWPRAAAYVLLSVAAGLLAVALGVRLGEWLRR